MESASRHPRIQRHPAEENASVTITIFILSLSWGTSALAAIMCFEKKHSPVRQMTRVLVASELINANSKRRGYDLSGLGPVWVEMVLPPGLFDSLSVGPRGQSRPPPLPSLICHGDTTILHVWVAPLRCSTCVCVATRRPSPPPPLMPRTGVACMHTY